MSDSPSSPQRTLPLRTIIVVTLFSLAVAALAGWWVGSRSTSDSTVSPEELLSGEARAESSVSGTAKIGATAPRTTFTYLGGGTGSLTDEEFRGKTLLVNFWSSTCAPCLREMPALDQVAREQQDTLVVLGVDVTDGIEAGTKMVRRTGVTYRIARDPDGKIMAAFGGRQLPHSVLIGPDGVVRAIHDGAMDHQEIRDLVAS